jgi:hypothetical protein
LRLPWGYLVVEHELVDGGVDRSGVWLGGSDAQNFLVLLLNFLLQGVQLFSQVFFALQSAPHRRFVLILFSLDNIEIIGGIWRYLAIS